MDGKRVLIFYKPYGVMSTFTDPEGRRTLKEFIPVEGVYSAGRLDYDSEGLLILTNDGNLIHQLTDPKMHATKTYLAQVEGEFSEEKIHQLEKGVVLHGVLTRKCKVMRVATPDIPPREVPITPHGPTFWLRIVITEGKKHQVRKMTAAIGYPCLRLLRIAEGNLGLGDLRPGEWRDLSDEEIRMLVPKRGFHHAREGNRKKPGV